MNEIKGDTVLLVIDVQVGIIDGFSAYRGADVLQGINTLLDRARASETPVIYVQHGGGDDHPLKPNTPAWQIHPAIKPRDGELIINKRSSDSFFETSLKRELEARGIKHLVVTGCMTEYCVDTACRSAVAHGFDVTLASDAHTTIDNAVLKAEQIIAHHNALLDGFDAGAHSVTVKPTDSIEF
ncbi:MAG: cysteine hydrolase family protein [Acidobacteriota bacterium]